MVGSSSHAHTFMDASAELVPALGSTFRMCRWRPAAQGTRPVENVAQDGHGGQSRAGVEVGGTKSEPLGASVSEAGPSCSEALC